MVGILRRILGLVDSTNDLQMQISRPKSGDCFVVLDIETTGLNPERDQIIEVAAIRVNPSSEEQPTFSRLIKCDKKLPKKIVDLTGITDEMLKEDGQDILSVLRQLKAFIGDLPLVMYNAQFDVSFILAAADRYGLKFNNKAVCALESARRSLVLDSYKLVDVAKNLDVYEQKSHRALDDCLMTLRVYDKIIASGRF